MNCVLRGSLNPANISLLYAGDNNMIYAIQKGKYGLTFAFDTKFQSKVENAMLYMGHGGNGYYLSSEKPETSAIRVKILDKHGMKFTVSA